MRILLFLFIALSLSAGDIINRDLKGVVKDVKYIAKAKVLKVKYEEEHIKLGSREGTNTIVKLTVEIQSFLKGKLEKKEINLVYQYPSGNSSVTISGSGLEMDLKKGKSYIFLFTQGKTVDYLWRAEKLKSEAKIKKLLKN